MRALIHRLSSWQSLLIVAMVGIILVRFSAPLQFPFGYDQTNFVEYGIQILSGNVTLIGPKTGFANMHVGPLTYYLAAFSGLFVNFPFALILAQCIAVVATYLSIFFLARRYLQKELRWVVFLLLGFSPFFIQFDQQFWNPSLLLLASSLVFFPLVKVSTLTKRDLVIIAIGCFLGFQAHFSGLLLPPLAVLLYLLTQRKHFFSIVFATVVGTIATLLPLIIFDLRNDWLNTHGFIELFTRRSSGLPWSFVFVALDNLRITLENIGKLLFNHSSYPFVIATGLILTLTSLWIYWKTRSKSILITVLWLTIIAIAYALYSGPKPEYYYLIQFPAIALLVANALQYFLHSFTRTAVVLLLVPVALLTMLLAPTQNSLSIGNLHQVQNYILELALNQGISEIIYDMNIADREGIQYLLKNLELQENGLTLHIAYPESVPYNSAVQFEKVTVWVDPRTASRHVTEPDYIILFPKGLSIYKDSSNPLVIGKPFRYVVYSQDILLGYMYIIDDKNSGESWSEIEGTWEELVPSEIRWIETNFDGRRGLLFVSKRTAFFFIPMDTAQTEEILKTLENVTFY